MLSHCLPAIKNVTGLYKARSFKVDTIYADKEFKSLKQNLLDTDNILVNIAATNELVPKIERVIRTIKERNRGTVHSLPYKRVPKVLKQAMLVKEVTWLNSFTQADGVSPVLIPRTIVTGLQVDFATYCRVPIGAYCEVHDEPTISNTEKSRTTPAIALNPTVNLQGSYHFMSLDTGKALNRRKWTELPITQNSLIGYTT